jgi:KipI family sensor histidine kinase inhibitor
VRLRPCGDRAVLLDCASLPEAQAWHAALQHLDPVLGARTVLLRGDVRRLRDAVAHATPVASEAAPQHSDAAKEVVIPVVYDGDDLDEVGRLTGWGARGVVEAHTAATWVAAFTGFAPGFAYLTGGGPRLAVPRRAQPRPAVPAGAVALAGEFSGIYPRSSPGGWQLIGRTDVVLFDVDRTPPALLTPGTRVRFEASR